LNSTEADYSAEFRNRIFPVRFKLFGKLSEGSPHNFCSLSLPTPLVGRYPSFHGRTNIDHEVRGTSVSEEVEQLPKSNKRKREKLASKAESASSFVE
jgi:hypothetical protein